MQKDKIKQYTVARVSWIFNVNGSPRPPFNFFTIIFIMLLENYSRILLKEIVRYCKGGVSAQLLKY